MACSHYWECEAVSGPASRARCRLCGEEAVFGNYLTSELVDLLPWEPATTYLPDSRIPIEEMSAVDPEPDPPLAKKEDSKKREGGCDHEWDIGDEDNRGISHQVCRLCHLEFWVDRDGDLHDPEGDRLRHGLQLARGGGRRAVSRHQQRHKETKAELEELLKGAGSVVALAKKMGMTYKACHSLLHYREVDTSGYVVAKVAGKKKAKAEAEAQVTPPIVEAEGLVLQNVYNVIAALVADVSKLRDRVEEIAPLLQLPVPSIPDLEKMLNKAVDEVLSKALTPQCRLAWDNGLPVFVCESERDAKRMKELLDWNKYTMTVDKET